MNYYQYNSFEALVNELVGSTVCGLVHDYKDSLSFTPTIFLLPESPSDAADLEDEINELSACFTIVGKLIGGLRKKKMRCFANCDG
jgi:hypothetical protein